ncbi:MAG: hypothetical protein U0414_40115 [Polyangiaceae bacterium]
MPTFLTTPRMSPELAARVEASVTGRRGKASPLRTALARFAVLAAVTGAAILFVFHRPKCSDDVDQERAVFTAELREAMADVTDADRAAIPRATAWIIAHAGEYEGDFVAPTLREPAKLAATLARPILYLRGARESLATSEGIERAAEESFRDAFVLCLVSPPEKRTEKALLSRARAAFSTAESPAANVERLESALLAVPILAPGWDERVKKADSQKAIGSLRSIVKKAQLDVAKRAMRAELLLVLIDEPKEGDGPTELDGASPHHVRVELADLASGEVLLRLRRFIDPSWISEGARIEYATGINACELALDTRAAILEKK